jgi:uncharacterized protein YraI
MDHILDTKIANLSKRITNVELDLHSNDEKVNELQIKAEEIKYKSTKSDMRASNSRITSLEAVVPSSAESTFVTSLRSGPSTTIPGTLVVSGGVTGDVTGDLNGDVTGNVTGDVDVSSDTLTTSLAQKAAIVEASGRAKVVVSANAVIGFPIISFPVIILPANSLITSVTVLVVTDIYQIGPSSNEFSLYVAGYDIIPAVPDSFAVGELLVNNGNSTIPEIATVLDARKPLVFNSGRNFSTSTRTIYAKVENMGDYYTNDGEVRCIIEYIVVS